MKLSELKDGQATGFIVSADSFAGFSAVSVSVSVQMIVVAWSRILR
ncbi:MAG: hypothetical protein HGB06_01400 [Chlorobaculum sp.]|nr:hypothetical protein [Chlorobaculum sp.]